MVVINIRGSEKRYSYITPEDYETAERNGIKKATLETRVYKMGWDIDRAITQPVQAQGKWKEDWLAWKDIANVCRATFYSRKESGWSSVRAALLPPMTKKEIAQKLRRYTKEQLDQAAELGITRRLISYRTTVMGWSVEKAISTPKMSKAEAGQLRYGKKGSHE